MDQGIEPCALGVPCFRCGRGGRRGLGGSDGLVEGAAGAESHHRGHEEDRAEDERERQVGCQEVSEGGVAGEVIRALREQNHEDHVDERPPGSPRDRRRERREAGKGGEPQRLVLRDLRPVPRHEPQCDHHDVGERVDGRGPLHPHRAAERGEAERDPGSEHEDGRGGSPPPRDECRHFEDLRHEQREVAEISDRDESREHPEKSVGSRRAAIVRLLPGVPGRLVSDGGHPTVRASAATRPRRHVCTDPSSWVRDDLPPRTSGGSAAGSR